MNTPVLIIGSGLAGLITAYQLGKQGLECTVVTPEEFPIEGTNSVYAQGGIIYRSSDDDPESLTADVMAAGDQINFEPAVRQLAHDGIRYVEEILIKELNVPFDTSERSLSFTKEAAHGLPRIIHVKDRTGRAIMEALWVAVKKLRSVRILDGYSLVDLLTSGHNCKGYEFKYQRNRCLGAFLFESKTKTVKKILADFTVLATGGIGQVYSYHTNSVHAYGAGLAAANRAKARIINARFVQFHPTALWTPKKGRRFLISEALRGEGARLMNAEGKYFMDHFPLKDLESRAVVSRAIMDELQQSQREYVSLNVFEHYQGEVPIPERFPSIYEACKEEGIDISKEPIPVVPAEHFFCGGIFVDLNGQTELDGLFAVGEVSCTGVHGANRLASTSLLECLTWGVKASEKITDLLSKIDPEHLERAFSLVEEWHSFGENLPDSKEIELEKETIRGIMWNNVGIIRTSERLYRARDELMEIQKRVEDRYARSLLSSELLELRHMAETALIVTNSAASHTNLMRDSLGGHVLV